MAEQGRSSVDGVQAHFSFPFFSNPPRIIYLYTGLAAAAVAVVITVLVLDKEKRKAIILLTTPSTANPSTIYPLIRLPVQGYDALYRPLLASSPFPKATDHRLRERDYSSQDPWDL